MVSGKQIQLIQKPAKFSFLNEPVSHVVLVSKKYRKFSTKDTPLI